MRSPPWPSKTATATVEPSLETAANGEYTPLVRELNTHPSMSALEPDHIAELMRFFVEQMGQ